MDMNVSNYKEHKLPVLFNSLFLRTLFPYQNNSNHSLQKNKSTLISQYCGCHLVTWARSSMRHSLDDHIWKTLHVFSTVHPEAFTRKYSMSRSPAKHSFRHHSQYYLCIQYLVAIKPLYMQGFYYTSHTAIPQYVYYIFITCITLI